MLVHVQEFFNLFFVMSWIPDVSDDDASSDANWLVDCKSDSSSADWLNCDESSGAGVEFNPVVEPDCNIIVLPATAALDIPVATATTVHVRPLAENGFKILARP